MDRELTENEKTEYRKKFGPRKQHDSTELIGISYPTAIKWLLIWIFLFMPFLVEYGLNSIGMNAYVNDSGGFVPNEENHDEAIIQVYEARTWGLKGAFAVHSWIAMKRQGSDDFEVSQVIGWRQDGFGNVLFRETNVPINFWWGKEATLLLDLRGEDVEAIIDKVDAAIKEYPWKRDYSLFPGPNSNTFVAWIGLQVPELGLDLPSTAIGKDWRPLEHSFGPSASGTGLQASLYGLLGTSIGFEEGLELNILGLNFELDLFDLAVEIPLFGRYETWYLLSYLIIWLAAKKWINSTKSKYFNLA